MPQCGRGQKSKSKFHYGPLRDFSMQSKSRVKRNNEYNKVMMN